jgi:mutator protein MutT
MPSAEGDVVRRIPVVAAVIRRRGKVLLGRRPGGKRHGGRWEFPGGKILGREGVHDALARELQEELGLELEALGPELLVVPDPGSDFSIHFHAAEVTGVPTALEHEEIRWCDGQALSLLDLAPADAAFARVCLSELP